MAQSFHHDTDILAAVVDCKGFNHAADQLGISPALVSRRIRALEQQLGVTLLTRSTRTFELTTEGILLYQHAKKVSQDKHTTLQAIEALSSKTAGLLRISAPVNFGRQFVLSALNEFMKIYPNIEIDLRLSNDQVDLIKQKFDLVIRGAGYLDQESLAANRLIAKQLLTSPIILCASPDYLQRNNTIEQPSDLDNNHLGIDFTPDAMKKTTSTIKWKATSNNIPMEINLRKQLTCNDIDATIKASIDGNGITKVPAINVRNELQAKQLIQLLPTLDLGEYHLFAVFPQRVLPQRTRALLEYFEQLWQ
ncbi:MAG: LysR family transcriptional regulator [Coxiellaceae bacterium]|nr:LysR family transcriptional regulator [Coxiellaceae bacterium]